MDTQPLLTHLTSVDPYFRLLNNIRTRRKALQWQAYAQHDTSPLYEKAIGELYRHENLLRNIDSHTEPDSFRYISRWFSSLGNTEEHCLRLFDVFLTPNPATSKDELETRFLRNLKLSNSKIRVHELKTRIYLETLHRLSLGWYPVFNTLTVTNDHYQRVFEKDSRDFQNYIDRFKYAIRKATPHVSNSHSSKHLHSYFAVVEEGDERGRLHFHVLHFCKHLPLGSIDPNNGRTIPNHRVIQSCWNFWHCGFSKPIAVRLNGLDNYARLGWRWPVEKKNRNWVAIDASNPLRLANYLAKYITKGIEKDTYQWRTRTSHNFGATLLKLSLEKLSDSQIDTLLKMTPQMLKINDLQLPTQLVKKLTTKELLARLRNEPNNSKKSMRLKSLIHIKPQPSIVEQYRTLIHTKPNHNSQNIGSKLTTNSNASDTFKVRQSFLDTLTKFGYSEIEIASRGFNPRF